MNRQDADKKEVMDRYYQLALQETAEYKCKQFGCGKTLSRQEYLFGGYCINHNMKYAMQKENLFELDCIRTVSGKYVNVFKPVPEMISIEDIAHALAHQPRFGGHLPQFYSVAQHSLWCCHLVPEKHKLAALLHDASEAYLIDVPRPVKLKLTNYKEIEDRLMILIAEKFGFQYPFVKAIKAADEHMLREEWECLMLGNNSSIEPYEPNKAKLFFLAEFKRLKSA